MTTRAVRLGLLAAAVTLLAGCGIDTGKEGRPDADVSTTPGSTSTIDAEKTERLPKRDPGVVEVRGPSQGSLTPEATVGVSGVRVNLITVDEAEGIADLCAGRIDVLDISRGLTVAERRRCDRNGVELADPIQVASDAIIVATPNESDVGGDCLRMSTVNDIFRAGSPLTNWSQVGFFDIPLRTTGPGAGTPAFEFFAQAVFNRPFNASLSDMRSDYIERRTDNGVRFEVTSFSREQRVKRKYGQRLEDLTVERSLALQRAIDDAIADTRRRVLAQFDEEDEARAESEVVLTEEQKALIARRNRRIIDRALREAQDRAIRRFSYPRLTFARNRYRAELRRARLKGTIGIFRFSYYELYEQQLRPMEIWDPDIAAQALAAMNGTQSVRDSDTAETTTTTTTTTATATTGTGATSTATTTTPATTEDAAEEGDDVVVNADRTPWCVFPSQQTITNGSYPLSRRLLLYVSRLNLKREEVQTFLSSYLERAQQLAVSNRLVPVPQDVADRNDRIIEGDLTPGVADETSTTPGSSTTTTETTPQNVPGVGQGTTPTTGTTPATTTTSTTSTTATTTP